MANIFQKLSGSLSNFRIGGASGPQFKNANGAVQVRNSDDSGFAPLKVGSPSTGASGGASFGQQDVVNAHMLRSFLIAAEFDGNSVPSNTGAQRFLVCTTAGGSYSLGDLAFDNGTGVGGIFRIEAATGVMISVPTALTGLPQGVYVWTGSGWASFIAGYAGVNRSIMVPFTSGSFGSGTVSSTATIPANANILRTRVRVDNGGAFDTGTVSVGYSGAPALLMATTDSVLTASGVYVVDGTTTNDNWDSSARAVLLTFTGSPTAGSGHVLVEYCTPDT